MSSPRRPRAPFDPRTWFGSPRQAPAGTPFERGLAALDAGRHAEAFEALSEALDVAADRAARVAACNKRGVASIALGKRVAALEDFCAALALDERYAPALVNVGNLLLEDGHVADAIDYYRAALRADERYAGAHRNLGVALKKTGNHAEAVRHLRSAMRLEIRVPLKGRR
jgi:tetratricopeptide (TPR) repeat protein